MVLYNQQFQLPVFWCLDPDHGQYAEPPVIALNLEARHLHPACLAGSLSHSVLQTHELMGKYPVTNKNSSPGSCDFLTEDKPLSAPPWHHNQADCCLTKKTSSVSPWPSQHPPRTWLVLQKDGLRHDSAAFLLHWEETTFLSSSSSRLAFGDSVAVGGSLEPTELGLWAKSPVRLVGLTKRNTSHKTLH